MSNTIDAEFTEYSALVVANQHQLAMPVVSPIQAKEAMDAYINLCKAVLKDDDYQVFKQYDYKTKKQVEKKFIKKSGVKKLQVFFGISVKIVDKTLDNLADGHFGFNVTALATRRDGGSAEECAGCSTYEERFLPARYDDESDVKFESRKKKALARAYHDVLSTAQTRASNRAIMSAIGVGGGEVTAEEMSASNNQRYSTPKPQANDNKAPSIQSLMMKAKAKNLCVDGATFCAWAAKNVFGCENFAPGVKPTPEQCIAISEEL